MQLVKLNYLFAFQINDLKRTNNLINEQGFFALRRLKIPVKKHGLLTELEEELKRRPIATTSLIGSSADPSATNEHSSSNDVYHRVDDDVDYDDGIETSQLLIPKANHASKESTIDANDTGKFLKSVDKEIRKTIKMNDKMGVEKNEALEEVVSSLGSVGYRPLPFPTAKTKECDGATWGVKWSTLLICFVIFLIVFIIFVVIKFKSDEHPSNTIVATPPGKS